MLLLLFQSCCLLHLLLTPTVHSVKSCCVGTVYTSPPQVSVGNPNNYQNPSNVVLYSCDQKNDNNNDNNNNINCITIGAGTTKVQYACAWNVVSPTPTPVPSNTTNTTTNQQGYTANVNASYPYCAMGDCCSKENCNCPKYVDKTTDQVQTIGGQMRSIMYPVMGVIFGLLWVAIAFIAHMIPLPMLLLGNGAVTAVFGVFLILTPITTYLGLLYIAVGSFAIAVVRGNGDKTAFKAVGVTSFIVFLLTGGLTLVALDNFNQNTQGNYMDRLLNTVGTCDASMDIVVYNNEYFNLSVRCENYLLLVCFCVYLLFLLQPFTMIASFLVTVETKETGKPPNQL